MDVKQAFDAVMANPAAYARSILLTVLVIAALIALFKVGPRLWRVVEEVFFTNWQLAMLGTAAIVLNNAPPLSGEGCGDLAWMWCAGL